MKKRLRIIASKDGILSKTIFSRRKWNTLPAFKGHRTLQVIIVKKSSNALASSTLVGLTSKH